MRVFRSGNTTSLSTDDAGAGGGTYSVSHLCKKRPKLRLSGSARKSQKRDTPRLKLQAVLARIQPFYPAAQRNGATNPDSNP